MSAGLLLIAAAFAQDEAPGEDFRGYLDQARFFERKQWWDDAAEQLELAVQHPDGAADPEAWQMLARVRFQQADLPGSREAADKAHTYSRDEDQLALGAGFNAMVHEQFGLVRVNAPQPGLTARLTIEPTGMVFLTPDQQEFLEKIQARYKKSQLLPVEFGLPLGTYLINGREVAIGPDTAVLDLTGAELQEGFTAVKLLQAEFSAGMALWIGPDVPNQRPSLDLQLALSLPLQDFRFAIVGDWVPTTYSLWDAKVDTNPAGGSIGLRAGYEVPDTEPIFIRPSIGYRYAWVPGQYLTCTANSAGDPSSGFLCGQTDSIDLVVYGVGRAHVPWLELSVGHLDNRRTTALGFGVKGVVEYAFGTLPKQARTNLDGELVTYETDPDARQWDAFGVRLLATLSLAF